jgi:glycosyltransferase involved in cell wall biosynthesis
LKTGYYKAVCATSGEDAAALEQLAGLSAGAVEVVSNGVNAAYFAPGDQREADTVIFSGKMSYHANAAAARYFIKNIWPLVRFARPNARLWVVGSRPPQDLIEVSGKHGIKVTGQVADMRDYLRRASVAVAPMVYSVGIQNKVLEAMACATPVVATGDIQRSIEAETGVALELVAPGNPTDFAGKVVDLLQNPKDASALGERGRDFVTTNYTWEKAANRLEQLWQKASGKPKIAEKELVHPSLANLNSK